MSPVALENYFYSTLDQRLLEHIVSLNMLHNSQIGFLPNNRTADHGLHSPNLDR